MFVVLLILAYPSKLLIEVTRVFAADGGLPATGLAIVRRVGRHVVPAVEGMLQY